MSSTIRRALALAAAIVVAASLALTGTTSAGAAAKTTTVTVAIADCEGCEVTLASFTAEDPADGWVADPVAVEDGKAVVDVPTDRTLGLTIAVHTPWEGHLGYETYAALRYTGETVGERIGFRKARTMEKASGCYAGTHATELTIRLKVKRVMLDGVFHRVPGQIVFAPTTQEWLRPIYPVYGGVLGGNDYILCKAGSHGGRTAA